jgi:hypothetical protein
MKERTKKENQSILKKYFLFVSLFSRNRFSFAGTDGKYKLLKPENSSLML